MIAFNRHYEGDGAIIFKYACTLGCEGIVSKRLGSPYRFGRVDHWLKIKNPAAPAVRRETEEEWACKRWGRRAARRNTSPAGQREGDQVSEGASAGHVGSQVLAAAVPVERRFLLYIADETKPPSSPVSGCNSSVARTTSRVLPVLPLTRLGARYGRAG
jgi:hypothetical protein